MASTLFLIELKREVHKVNMNLLVSKKYKTQISRMIQILVCTDDKRLKIWGLKLKGGAMSVQTGTGGREWMHQR